MEAVLLQYSSSLDHHQSLSPYKHQTRKANNKRVNRSIVSRPCENLAASSTFHGQGHGGLLQAPPPPPSSSLQPPPFFPLRSFPAPPVLLQQQQPPLLPLPIYKPLLSNNNYPQRSRRSSCPPNRRRNRPRDQSLTPKKSNSPKKVEDDSPKSKQHSTKTEISLSDCLMIMSSTKPLGPDPKDLPMAITDVLKRALCSGSRMTTTTAMPILKEADDKFSGSVAFTISPPPSSLPLPTFPVRTKLSCNAEDAASAGIDAGATDNLRRLLRL